MKEKKPRVITNCVASHYAMKNETIIEYSFGGDGKGGAIGGLIQFVWVNGEPRVTLYCHDKEIKIIVGKGEEL
jgi:hypothetical protein